MSFRSFVVPDLKSFQEKPPDKFEVGKSWMSFCVFFSFASQPSFLSAQTSQRYASSSPCISHQTKMEIRPYTMRFACFLLTGALESPLWLSALSHRGPVLCHLFQLVGNVCGCQKRLALVVWGTHSKARPTVNCIFPQSYWAIIMALEVNNASSSSQGDN